MKRFRAGIATVVAAMAMAPAPAVAKGWPIGKEREASPGVYATLVSNAGGWQIWKFERKEGVTCKAVKPALGRRMPVPAGGDLLEGGYPFVEIALLRDGSYWWTFRGQHISVRGESLREPGARFWDSRSVFDAAALEGKKYEVRVESWEYPNIKVGYAENVGIIDFSGVGAAAERLRSECPPPA